MKNVIYLHDYKEPIYVTDEQLKKYEKLIDNGDYEQAKSFVNEIIKE